MDTILRDIVRALRSWRRHPAFAVTAFVTLALGTGANAAIFSVFNQTLIRNLPVPAAEQLVNLSSPGPKGGGSISTSDAGGPEAVFSHPQFRDLERMQTVFSAIAAHRNFDATVTFGQDA